MEYIGYLSSIFIGIILGLIGSGGSILTIPVLVYLFSVDVILATSYSLFIVGLTSAIGSLSYLKHKLVNTRVALLFGLPSVLSVLVTRALLLPAIPEHIFTLGEFQLNKNIMLLLLFALLMIGAAFSMIRKPVVVEEGAKQNSSGSFGWIIFQGLLIGVVTGLMGAGGGFLIVPALILFQKLPMKEAIGTSLIIIASNSLLGFIGTHDKTHINWQFLMLISVLAIMGIFIGIWFSKKIDPYKLKPVFGWFVLIMGIYIILKETLF
jgi:uncharacterized membrane protein YfcA